VDALLCSMLVRRLEEQRAQNLKMTSSTWKRLGLRIASFATVSIYAFINVMCVSRVIQFFLVFMYMSSRPRVSQGRDVHCTVYSYLTLPSGGGGAGYYTCAALRPYRLGPMRNHDVTAGTYCKSSSSPYFLS